MLGFAIGPDFPVFYKIDFQTEVGVIQGYGVMIPKTVLDTLLIGMTPGLRGFTGLYLVKQGRMITRFSTQNEAIIQ